MLVSSFPSHRNTITCANKLQINTNKCPWHTTSLPDNYFSNSFSAELKRQSFPRAIPRWHSGGINLQGWRLSPWPLYAGLFSPMLPLLTQMWPLKAEGCHGRWMRWASPVTLTIPQCQVSWRIFLSCFEHKTFRRPGPSRTPLALAWSPWVSQDITFPRTLTRGKFNLSWE